ncbi:hypothetical protein [Xanthomonas dyei]|uniref:hypothetical protein n=1 Tax=Xanthomonas dyei TaxID=743699 RepID=UPI001E536A61|nr:hypothetical protein [Xanthomonas dyei]
MTQASDAQCTTECVLDSLHPRSQPASAVFAPDAIDAERPRALWVRSEKLVGERF